jgi:hypothetical protein
MPNNTPGGSGSSLNIGLGGSSGSSRLAALNPSNLSGIASAAGPYADTTPIASSGILASGESITGLTAGLQQAGFPSSRAGLNGSGTQQGVAADVGQQGTVFCPQLAFRPLVVGCESLFNPITGEALAKTGLSILIGLTGLLTIGVGWLLYVRSRAADRVMRPTTSAGIVAGPRRRGLGAIARTLTVERVQR